MIRFEQPNRSSHFSSKSAAKIAILLFGPSIFSSPVADSQKNGALFPEEVSVPSRHGCLRVLSHFQELQSLRHRVTSSSPAEPGGIYIASSLVGDFSMGISKVGDVGRPQ